MGRQPTAGMTVPFPPNLASSLPTARFVQPWCLGVFVVHLSSTNRVTVLEWSRGKERASLGVDSPQRHQDTKAAQSLPTDTAHQAMRVGILSRLPKVRGRSTLNWQQTVRTPPKVAMAVPSGVNRRTQRFAPIQTDPLPPDAIMGNGQDLIGPSRRVRASSPQRDPIVAWRMAGTGTAMTEGGRPMGVKIGGARAHVVMAGEGRPSTPSSCSHQQDVDGRPSPAMTMWARPVLQVGAAGAPGGRGRCSRWARPVLQAAILTRMGRAPPNQSRSPRFWSAPAILYDPNVSRGSDPPGPSRKPERSHEVLR